MYHGNVDVLVLTGFVIPISQPDEKLRQFALPDINLTKVQFRESMLSG